MRLKPQQINMIRLTVKNLAGDDAKVKLFGSRVDDNAHGGDIDLLVDVQHTVDEPAWLTAQLTAQISIALGGQKVDVVLMAPNLQRYNIHDVAIEQGITL